MVRISLGGQKTVELLQVSRHARLKIPGGDGTLPEVCINRIFFNTDGTIVPVQPTLQGLQAAVSP
jgi:hypothetical protein